MQWWQTPERQTDRTVFRHSYCTKRYRTVISVKSPTHIKFNINYTKILKFSHSTWTMVIIIVQYIGFAVYLQCVEYVECAQYAHWVQYAQYAHHKLPYTTPVSLLLSTNQSANKQQTYQIQFVAINCVLPTRSVLLNWWRYWWVETCSDLPWL